MPVKKRLEVAGVNIRVHPHDRPDIYVNLIRDIFALKKRIRVHGSTHFLLTSLDSSSHKRDGLITGTFARFTVIDSDQPWFDEATLNEADETAVEKINIPEGLYPNFKSFFFALDPKKHVIAVETRSGQEAVSPRMVLSFLEKLASSKAVVRKYGQPSVDLIAGADALKALWSQHKIEKMHIKIKRPNPDLPGIRQRLATEMTDQNVHEMEISYKAIQESSIAPNDETKLIAEVASENGIVKATGKDETGKKFEFSSESHPKVIREFFDPNLLTDWQAFLKAAAKLFL